MTDDPASPVPPQRQGGLSHLAALLAERGLSEQDVGQSISNARVHAVLDAVILLDKYDAELRTALNRLVNQLDEASRSKDGASGLAWPLRPFQGVKG